MHKFNEFNVAKIIAEHCAGRNHIRKDEWKACYVMVRENYGYENMTVEQFKPVWDVILAYLEKR